MKDGISVCVRAILGTHVRFDMCLGFKLYTVCLSTVMLFYYLLLHD